MTPLFKKLNLKEQREILVLNHPASFNQELLAIEPYVQVINNIENVSEISFVICFVINQNEIDAFASEINQKVKGDAVIWFCYPKSTSKKYSCNFNRDTGWKNFDQYQLEPVRQVAIDEDWSALRFRKVTFIKTITRKESYAITQEAKNRTTQKNK